MQFHTVTREEKVRLHEHACFGNETCFLWTDLSDSVKKEGFENVVIKSCPSDHMDRVVTEMCSKCDCSYQKHVNTV